MRTWIVAAGLGFLAMNGVAQPVTGMGVYKFGMSQDAAKKATRGTAFNCNVNSSLVKAPEKVCRVMEYWVLNFYTGTAFITFSAEDKAEQFQYRGELRDYAIARRVLTERLGEPREKRATSWWDQDGTRLDGEELVWSTPEAVVTLEQFLPWGDGGWRFGVTISTPRWHQTMAAREKERDDRTFKELTGE